MVLFLPVFSLQSNNLNGFSSVHILITCLINIALRLSDQNTQFHIVNKITHENRPLPHWQPEQEYGMGLAYRQGKRLLHNS
jgi:hypothetical protein